MVPENFKDKNYYEILGITRDATEKEVRDAYRDLSRYYDPESEYRKKVIQNPISPEELKAYELITQAHDTLTDFKQRLEYDRTLPSGIYYFEQTQLVYPEGEQPQTGQPQEAQDPIEQLIPGIAEHISDKTTKIPEELLPPRENPLPRKVETSEEAARPTSNPPPIQPPPATMHTEVAETEEFDLQNQKVADEPNLLEATRNPSGVVSFAPIDQPAPDGTPLQKPHPRRASLEMPRSMVTELLSPPKPRKTFLDWLLIFLAVGLPLITVLWAVTFIFDELI